MTAREIAERYAGKWVVTTDVSAIVPQGINVKIVGWRDGMFGPVVVTATDSPVFGRPSPFGGAFIASEAQPRSGWVQTADTSMTNFLEVDPPHLELPTWEPSVWVDPRYPHRCPACRAAAYVGVVPADVKCSSHGCRHHGA